MKKRRKDVPQPVYKTEEMLKEEARKRAEQERLQESAKQKSPRRTKWDNYWYHYKWQTIGGILAVLFVAFMLKDTVFATKPDITIVAVTTESYLSSTQAEQISAYLEENAPDFNGDGKVVVLIDALNLGNVNDNASMSQDSYAANMKLVTLLAAATDPVFLMDEGALKHLMREPEPLPGEEAVEQEPVAAEDLFATLDTIPKADGVALPVYNTSLAQTELGKSLEHMSFYLRPANLFEKKQDYYAYCYALLQSLSS